MYELLAQRAFNTPLLIEAGKLDIISDVLIGRIKNETLPDYKPEHEAFSVSGKAERKEGGYYLSGSVGVIDIHGSLVHRSSWLGAASGMVGYEIISSRLDSALADETVKSILLNMDSPGGEVAGAFDLADKIKAVNEKKPIYALAADAMCSACYLLASNATKIIATQTANIGSIGVVMKHVDLSGMDKKEGVKATYIYAGENKVDGNPHEALSHDAKARAQAGVDRIYNMFIDVVSQGRTMERQDVVDTKAETFIGSQAVKIGLADDVMSGEELLAKMNAQFSAYSNHSLNAEQEELPMADEKETVSAETSKDVSNDKETKTEASAEEKAKIIADSNNRAKTILNCEEAKGREKLANHLAFNTTMNTDDAVAILVEAPKSIAVKTSPLDDAMANTEQPEIGSDEGIESSKADEIFSSYHAATGYKKGA